MVLEEVYTLNNGVQVPKIGFGTWMIDNETTKQAVKDALEIGYRHIDTAQAYGNEQGVGEAINTSNLDRSEIFVTSKIDAELKDYKSALQSINESLQKLGLDYLDMMIIHSPQPWGEFRQSNYDKENLEVWRALEEAYKQGKIRAIGVSNFTQDDLNNILENGEIRPAVNQILAHIANTPFELIDYCENNDVLVEAFSPVAHGELMNHEEVKTMASEYQVTIPQLAIRYCLQLDLLPLPKSGNKDHIQNNAELDFKISEEDMKTLKNLEQLTDYGDSNSLPVFGEY